MDQLVYHELPRLNEALGGELRYVALKGYDHYPCLRKLERYAGELEAGADEDRLATVAALYAWTAQSSLGRPGRDQPALGPPRAARRDLRRRRPTARASAAGSTRNLCYLHGVRRRAASANVVVTNHALLFRDVVAQGGILPPLRHWIVDEAHSAESEARKQLTMGASHVELSAVLGALASQGPGRACSRTCGARCAAADTSSAVSA